MGLRVHYVDWMTTQERLDVVHQDLHQSLACCRTAPSNVGREVAVACCEQGIICLWRFLRKHIESGCSQLALVQGVSKCLFVNQRAASGIDQNGCGLHQLQAFGIDQPLGGGRKGAMKTDYIALAEELVELHLMDFALQLQG